MEFKLIIFFGVLLVLASACIVDSASLSRRNFRSVRDTEHSQVTNSSSDNQNVNVTSIQPATSSSRLSPSINSNSSYSPDKISDAITKNDNHEAVSTTQAPKVDAKTPRDQEISGTVTEKVSKSDERKTKDGKDEAKERKKETSRSLKIDIEKYISPDFHNKNNVYTLPTSPDIEKYLDPNFDNVDNDETRITSKNYFESTTSMHDYNIVLTTPRTNHFDAKFRQVTDKIQQNLDEQDVIIGYARNDGEAKETNDKFELPKLIESAQNPNNDTDVFLHAKEFKNIDIDTGEMRENREMEKGMTVDYESTFVKRSVYPENSVGSESSLSNNISNANEEEKKPIIDSEHVTANESVAASFLSKTIVPIMYTPKYKDLENGTADIKTPVTTLKPTKRPRNQLALYNNTIENENEINPKRSFTSTSEPIRLSVEPETERTTYVKPVTESSINISKRGSTKLTSSSNEPSTTNVIETTDFDNKNFTIPPSATAWTLVTLKDVPGQSTEKSGSYDDEDEGKWIKITTTTRETEMPTTSKVFPSSASEREFEITTTITTTTLADSTTTSIPETTTTSMVEENVTSEITDAPILAPTTTEIVNVSSETDETSLSTTTVDSISEQESLTTTVETISTTDTSYSATTSIRVLPEEVTTTSTSFSSTTEYFETTTEPETTSMKIEKLSSYFSSATETLETSTEEMISTTIPTTDIISTLPPNISEAIELANLKTKIPQTTTSTTTSKTVVQSQTTEAQDDDTEENNFGNDDDYAEIPIKKPTKNGTHASDTDASVLNNQNAGRIGNKSVENERPGETGTTTLPSNDNATNDTTSATEHLSHDENPEDNNSGMVAAIAISTVGGICLILLAGLLLVMRKRQKKITYRQRCRPVSLDAYSLDNVSVYNSVRGKIGLRTSKRSYGNPAFDDPVSVSHQMNFQSLAKFADDMDAIDAEFEEIPQVTARASEVPAGCETKNRYANIIPLPETRVYLKAFDNDPHSDYINANYVTGPKNTRRYYIGCQAPMQSTVDDFWRMIWEQQSRVILMLTNLYENGVEKCADYLPPSEVVDCHRLFGDFQITLKKREVKEKYIISSLQLKNMVSNSWREVIHLWYLGWPERGVPSEANSLIAFLIEARSHLKATTNLSDNKASETSNMHISSGASGGEGSGPVVVHCSPGTGRTGTVIACDIAIRDFELSRSVDIPKIVYRVRRDRASAVQTREQYAFIYKVIALYATKLTGGALESI